MDQRDSPTWTVASGFSNWAKVSRSSRAVLSTPCAVSADCPGYPGVRTSWDGSRQTPRDSVILSPRLFAPRRPDGRLIHTTQLCRHLVSRRCSGRI